MQPPLTVIGLAGIAGSGKDTVAGMLVANQSFTRLALADGIRASIGSLGGPSWDVQKEIEAGGMSVRLAMQLYGTEVREIVGCHSHWVDHLLLKIAYLNRVHPATRTRFVVSDIRYPFEAESIGEAVRGWGGRYETWRVDRPGLVPIAESGHSSETMVGGVVADRVITNDRDKADLVGLVECAMQYGGFLP